MNLDFYFPIVISLVLLIFVAFLTLCYAGLMLYLWFGLLKTPIPHSPLPTSKTAPLSFPSVSIVIPMHNEEEFIERTLQAINSQEYEGEWEVLFVNDRSTDKCPEIVQNFCENGSAENRRKIRLLNVPVNSPKIASPKKRALNTGFLEAKNEILLIADADCEPPKNWLKSMALHFADADVVQGAKANNGDNGFLHSYQKLETLGFTLIEAAGYNRNKPLVASAASLAYRKKLFFDCGGFENLYDLTSGDDDMLIHRMAKISGTKFTYNWDTSAIMPTAPVNSWLALLQQRARWGSNGANYENKFYSAFLFCIYAFFVWLCVSPFLIFAGLPAWYFALPFAVKFICDFLLLFSGAKKLKSLSLLWCFPFVEVIQIPLFSLAVPMGSLGLYRWK